jgi:transposase
VANYQALCRELAARGRFGELSATGARSVLQRYATAWFQAAARRQRGERASFPRRKRGLIPVRFYNGPFGFEGDRVRLPVGRGALPLWVRLARELPYPVEAVRSVTLLSEGRTLFLNVTAAVAVEEHKLEPGTVAGVDLGIIHPFAVAADAEGLLVSGGRCAPRPGCTSSTARHAPHT